jgi:hypothetical protein
MTWEKLWNNVDMDFNFSQRNKENWKPPNQGIQSLDHDTIMNFYLNMANNHLVQQWQNCSPNYEIVKMQALT